ncbi:MAG: WYL domain-containing protein [Clostridiales Family XIII bacterium]|jgi:predicted DNA-binding transcriptional regulator YafY|nr:WYL domain-containing protein [Clostridiales Family XIII bacterium]
MGKEKGKHTGSSKLNCLYILDILQKHSDRDHTLSASKINDLLYKEWDIRINRESIKKNLMSLVEFGHDINCKEKVRINSRGEEECVNTDWYINSEFDDSEIRYLIDGLLFSKQLTDKYCHDLIEKLEGLTSEHFKSHVKHVKVLHTSASRNPSLFENIEVLNEAINNKKQVSFNFMRYDTNKKLVTKLYPDGKPVKHIINPYQMVSTNGHYYLICNNDKYDNLAHYRLDLIKNIEKLDSSMKPIQKINEGKDFDLAKHMDEHIYMFNGESVKVKLRTDEDNMLALMDWFGDNFKITQEHHQDRKIDVELTVNENAMVYWAMQYGQYVTILAPESLREKVKVGLETALNKYK